MTNDAYLLRETLFDLAARDTSGFPDIDLTFITDEAGIISSKGLLAWLARDFSNARFLSVAGAASGDPIIITAEGDERANSLAGNYVGQRFLLRRKASLTDIDHWDWPVWWTQGRLAPELIEEEAVILWLRQDVYDGVST